MATQSPDQRASYHSLTGSSSCKTQALEIRAAVVELAKSHVPTEVTKVPSAACMSGEDGRERCEHEFSAWHGIPEGGSFAVDSHRGENEKRSPQLLHGPRSLLLPLQVAPLPQTLDEELNTSQLVSSCKRGIGVAGRCHMFVGQNPFGPKSRRNPIRFDAYRRGWTCTKCASGEATRRGN